MVLLCLFLICSTVHAQETEKQSTQELLDRLETLEKQLKKLEDENKTRKSLEVTEEEKIEQEKEVLEAVGREYTLSPKGTLSMDYTLGYSYSPTDEYTVEEEATMATLTVSSQRQANHQIQHTISAGYSLLDSLTTNVSVPVVYRYNKMGTEDELDQTDIGDISAGIYFQTPPRWTWLEMPFGIRNTYSISATFPTGRSPYKVNPKSELSTGGGVYDITVGSSFSKQIDPVVLFGSLGYSYPFPLKDVNLKIQDTVTLDEVESGSSVNASMGFGYALSYANSINMSFSYSYAFSTTLTYKELSKPIESGDSTSAQFSLGMGIMASPKTVVSVSMSYSLVNAGFSLSMRVPFDFVM